ncbi:FIST N-terminal domain-containing protein [Azospirillum sp. ST 5-10]|uniref:FIST N-terminal domain-containing protein n=1 Tax=unclassified Azospirillum TaxID=2630922 RepID=UPI003F49E43C
MPDSLQPPEPAVATLALPFAALAGPDGRDRLAELAVGGRAPRLVLGYASPHLDAADVARAVRDGLPAGTPLVLVSTAGELCPGRAGGLYAAADGPWDTVVLQSFGDGLFRDVSVHAVPLHSEDIRAGTVRLTHDQRIAAIADDLAAVAPPFALDCHDTVALAFVDGLSASENHFMEAVYGTGRFPVLFVGGSAGGTLDFTGTWIFDGRQILQNHAVIVFVKLAAGIRYGVLKSQNFRKSGVSFTILDADPVRRTVNSVIDPDTMEVTGFVDALCRSLGCAPGALEAELVDRTFAIELNGELFVRSVARIGGDGTVSFFCDVNPGDELFLVEATDFVAQTAADVAAFLAGKPPPVAGILNDCALRRLNNRARLASMSMFDGLPVAGFSTFGELLGINVNQTLSALFFFRFGDGEGFGDDYVSRFPVHYASYRTYFGLARQNRLSMLNRLRQRLIQTLLTRGEAAAPLYGRVEQITACAERAAAEEPGNLATAVVDLLGAVRLARRESEAAAMALCHREAELRLAEERRAAAEMRAELEGRIRKAQKLEALSCLAGGMAHEINNMLQPILGLTELAMDEVPADGPAHRNLARVIEAAQRAHGITAQVLRFSRADHATAAPLALAAAVRGAVGIVDLLARHGVAVHWRIAADDVVVRADETQLVQVLINLVRNAVDAMAQGGAVTISLAAEHCPPLAEGDRVFPEGRYAVLAVADQGSGMDAATLERIFDPFFTTKAVGKGTGLGLPMVHGTVADWGGRVAVTSAPGAGTTVRIVLPAVEADAYPDPPPLRGGGGS